MFPDGLAPAKPNAAVRFYSNVQGVILLSCQDRPCLKDQEPL